jgi:hypothetical protein
MCPGVEPEQLRNGGAGWEGRRGSGIGSEVPFAHYRKGRRGSGVGLERALVREKSLGVLSTVRCEVRPSTRYQRQ